MVQQYPSVLECRTMFMQYCYSKLEYLQLFVFHHVFLWIYTVETDQSEPVLTTASVNSWGVKSCNCPTEHIGTGALRDDFSLARDVAIATQIESHEGSDGHCHIEPQVPVMVGWDVVWLNL